MSIAEPSPTPSTGPREPGLLTSHLSAAGAARPRPTLPPTFDEILAGLDRADAGIRFGTGGELRSYAELGALIRGNAAHFGAAGVRPGDRVALSLESDAEHVVMLLTLIAMGAVPVSIKPRRGPGEDYAGMLRGVCQRFDVRFAQHELPVPPTVRPLSWDEHARTSDPVPAAGARPDDVAVVQFSSGSLGAPKAIPLRHRNLLANLRAILEVDGRHPDSVVYNFLPLSHDMGLIGGLLSNLARQNSLHLTSTQAFLRNPVDGFLLSRCETVPMPNFALRYLARALQSCASRGTALPPDLFSCVRTIYCGAEPIRHETVEALVRAAAPHGLDPRALVFSYGLAEATLIVSARRYDGTASSFHQLRDERILASVGTPVADTEVLVGERAAHGPLIAAEPGAEGSVFIRGPGVFDGYLDEAPVVQDGWFDTGDLGFVHGGELYLSGRRKDLIIVNGENLFPSDIEAVAARQPGVRDCIVLSEDDRFYLYVIAAPGQELDRTGLAAAVTQSFGTAPARVLTGEPGTILRTTSGKPMRQAMLALLRESRALS